MKKRQQAEKNADRFLGKMKKRYHIMGEQNPRNIRRQKNGLHSRQFTG